MNQAAFESAYVSEDGTFQTNTTRNISEGDLRQFASDISNSFEYKTGSSSVVSTQIFEIGGFNMNGGAIKQVYLGSSGNFYNTKFFGVTIFNDSDSIFRVSHVLPVVSTANDAPGFLVTSNTGLYVLGASSLINITAASGSSFGTSNQWDSSVENRGYVTLFF